MWRYYSFPVYIIPGFFSVDGRSILQYTADNRIFSNSSYIADTTSTADSTNPNISPKGCTSFLVDSCLIN